MMYAHVQIRVIINKNCEYVVLESSARLLSTQQCYSTLYYKNVCSTKILQSIT